MLVRRDTVYYLHRKYMSMLRYHERDANSGANVTNMYLSSLVYLILLETGLGSGQMRNTPKYIIVPNELVAMPTYKLLTFSCRDAVLSLKVMSVYCNNF